MQHPHCSFQPADLNKLNVLHVTGTKGKGSTSAFCDSLLRQAFAAKGSTAKVGLYTSPHMIAARERIRINGLPLSEEAFTKYFFEVWDRFAANPDRQEADTPLRPLYFRYLTTLCYHVFLSEQVSATILEVGIGGRYDSTNIVPSPVVTGITSLGIDHTFMLGDTIEKIAWQKGGIYKKGVPAFSVSQKPEAMTVVQQCAQEAGTSLFEEVKPAEEILAQLPQGLGLPGQHQLINASLALALVRGFLSSAVGQQVAPEAVQLLGTGPQLSQLEVAGLQEARWPGRCQVVPSNDRLEGVTWYLDGAHTTDSLAVCTQWYTERSRADANRASIQDAENAQSASTASAPLRALIFNCTSGRSAPQLLGTILEEIERDELRHPSAIASADSSRAFALARKYFDAVLFCTNTTYADGGSRGDLVSKAVDPSDLSALTVQRELQQAWEVLLAGPNGQAQDPSEQNKTQVQILPSIQHAIQAVETAAQQVGREAHVLVTGSLHLVGGVMAHLKDRDLLDEALASTHQAQQVPAKPLP